ncbi:dihydrofolate reductase [Frondihabitans sp. PhB188]|uniref:dihydrofolate reductase family protein n=1 Tax=Frondihabitans sp. PhB188 TaxID=2485200 RepID=UPI000F475A65|nr:dihydrofolate reductase family protein [Frondihabitans sp. PhB188]ROQ36501.1 dihydrofolate reductase [Frondihabitans sp. PhB188]
MSPLVVQTFLTLDGVAQGPGGSDEDTEGGFSHGGWQDDADLGDVVTDWEAKTAALLLGRKTYDIWAGAWGVWPEDAPGFMGEFTRRYNRVPKYVASTTLTELGWTNSHLLGADLPAEVRRVRDETDGELRVWGSTRLIRTLAEHDLVDEYRLVTYPVVLGTGKRLFSDGFPVTRLAQGEVRVLPSGVTVTSYTRRP